ncbi:SUMO-interacting motif-containing protein 1 [Clinocottus analis]|uniref:SUMO-interacting motif-containing protein 1 n=1 Tax=Clinocottus analis TaxID=304258 RepID=UPI0035C1457A
MDDVITLSSDSENDDSDVEVIGSFGAVMTKAESLPLTAVRVDVDINVSTLYIDLTDPRWTLPELKHKRQNSSALTVVDLTETDVANETIWETRNLPPDDTKLPKETEDHLTSNKQDCNLKKTSREPTVFALQKYCGNLKPKKKPLDSPMKHQNQAEKTQHRTAIVKLRRLPFNETQIAELQTSKCSVYLNKECTQMSLHLHELDNNSDTPECMINLSRTTSSNGTHLDPSLAESPPKLVETPIRQKETEDSNTVTNSVPHEPLLSEEDRSEAGTYIGDLGIESPGSFVWQEGSDGDEVNKDSRFDMDFTVASREDRQFVCPDTLRKIMAGPVQAMLEEEEKGFGDPEVLCRQSLSLVYSTIDENYPEGTLQLLSDLLQPGYYPPRDITSHLLRGILLDPQCPYHLCVQAFNLLKRTQRHHMADKTTVPWDWELLTSVMADQRPQCEVVGMLLDYIVQTLEDDFQAKRSISALHHSIAKATLSCDQHFPRVREVIKWLFSAIMKSTEHGETQKAARERDELIRMVSIFQRMLSLALEVDRSPALNSVKLSQELFHMLISDIPLRAHRMLLLESMQSKLLRCKLLEHLLDYACPVKTPLPMSLSLLLHFLKYCTLAPDPSDGTERWQRWEELVHLLWMLLLSYNKAMKGYLCNLVSDQRGNLGNLVFKPDDMIFKPAICESVEAFLSRSKADLGQALPLHVEESLMYLQEHLLDVCQC